ncbi:MAG: ATPase [Gammaproteobacteria bacterium]|nr:MAG: ATPase [Gammaproteobacteria bacterium]RKZ38466.1 MAG: ATPase [Gammaproteobacteria bacterium]RKZ77311.1 MAG: ATPase [Gammaproteobacteria bacterium]
MPKKSDLYLKNYRKLKEIAETMRDTDEPDIDQLVVMVAEATKAYKNCQVRIDAVEKTLGLAEEGGR